MWRRPRPWGTVRARLLRRLTSRIGHILLHLLLQPRDRLCNGLDLLLLCLLLLLQSLCNLSDVLLIRLIPLLECLLNLLNNFLDNLLCHLLSPLNCLPRCCNGSSQLIDLRPLLCLFLNDPLQKLLKHLHIILRLLLRLIGHDL